MDLSQVTWKKTEEGLTPFLEGRKVAWCPQLPSQDAFLRCPTFECLIFGSRGGGKTDVLLMDFMQHVGKGYGAEWRGILFRQTFPQLADVISKTKKWFPQFGEPAPSFNSSKNTWEWPSGETLRLSYMETEDDYWNMHGHSYPWIGWEELTTWPNDKCYKVMFSCSRSTRVEMPRKIRATTNSYGAGHSWVRKRFQLPIPPGQVRGPIISEEMSSGHVLKRTSVRALFEDNKVLLCAEPDYMDKIRMAARNPAELRAWVNDDWNIVAGGMFDDIWEPSTHIIPDIPMDKIPKDWTINRSYDHGQSKPFSVGWWAESNGEPMEIQTLSGKSKSIGQVKGDLFRIAEWYGCTDKPNEGVRMLSSQIAEGIRERQTNWGIDARTKPGPADTSIFDDYEPGKSVAGDMLRKGVRWRRADKRPGSRKHGWEQIRQFLKGAFPPKEAQDKRTTPGLFICERCDAFIRTVPVLSRDPKDLDDVDTRCEDHVGDGTRYRLRQQCAAEARVWNW